PEFVDTRKVAQGPRLARDAREQEGTDELRMCLQMSLTASAQGLEEAGHVLAGLLHARAHDGEVLARMNVDRVIQILLAVGCFGSPRRLRGDTSISFGEDGWPHAPLPDCEDYHAGE